MTHLSINFLKNKFYFTNYCKCYKFNPIDKFHRIYAYTPYLVLNLIDKHKALIITILLVGILVLCMFNIHLTQHNNYHSESYYEITPEDIKELEALNKINDLREALAKTNKAYNEDEEFKKAMKNFKSISNEDFEELSEASPEHFEPSEDLATASTYNVSSYALNQEALEKYKKTNDILSKRSEEKRDKNQKGNEVSTLTYSLKGRKLLNYDTPRYLCEEGGKVIVNITVNSQGKVTEAYINNASTTFNGCLTSHALEYAQSVLFDSSTLKSQIGSITFYFKSKH